MSRNKKDMFESDGDEDVVVVKKSIVKTNYKRKPVIFEADSKDAIAAKRRIAKKTYKKDMFESDGDEEEEDDEGYRLLDRTYLHVPFAYKDDVKTDGAKWDKVNAKWFIRKSHHNYDELVNKYQRKHFEWRGYGFQSREIFMGLDYERGPIVIKSHTYDKFV
jgi:hypothetical protein